jgi:hypothetical protein
MLIDIPYINLFDVKGVISCFSVFLWPPY